MVFIDGENLAIRFKGEVENNNRYDHVIEVPNVLVWSKILSAAAAGGRKDVVRKYYYTSVVGDGPKLNEVHDQLQSLGIEEPKVFKKDQGKGSKRVDISIAVDMLTHAHRKNYDVAVLVAGDEDYIPLVEAIKNGGARVVLWFIENGLNENLRRSADHYYDMGNILFNDFELSGD